MINAIVFDVDDTIYDQQAPFKRAIEKIFPYFDMKDINKAYIRYRHYSDVGFPRVFAKEWDINYFRFWRTNETLKDLGYDEITEEVGKAFQETYEEELDNIQMLDEMRLTLDFLREKKIPVGLITNGPTEHQLKKVKKLGLYEYVEPGRVIVSGATPFQKPEKEIFNLAARQFGMNPETTLYVGDSYDNDVLGSNRGGWKSMWFNHRGREIPKGKERLHDVEIDSFEQLFGAVKVLFDLPDNKYIMDFNDKTNPILEQGIQSGMMIAAEKMLAQDFDVMRVAEILELSKMEIKLLLLKGYK
ncbi:MAG: HAD family hydrolase [Streptococcaceae bacterium]|jgi:putative hydrolase of the HAD superfamily|nr:HAD family hydrolase [Streptococcaceae bacterium]